MNALRSLSGIELWQLAGWTMVHFLWLGALVAIAAAASRFLLRRAQPNIRYAFMLAWLIALAALPLIAAAWLYQNSPAPSARAGRAVVDLTTSTTLQSPSPIIELHQPELDETAIAATPLAPAPIPLASSAGPNLLPPTPAALNAPQSTPAPPTFWPTSLNPQLSTLNALIPYLPWLWLIGTPITFVLLITGVVGTRRLNNASQVLTAGPIPALLSQLAESLRITRRVTVAVCDRIAAPVLIGIIRPVILLPPAALTGWSPDEIEMVLLHELAHVRRSDNVVNLLQRLVESLLFFHPAVWLISSWVRSEREACCDALVVRRTNRPHAYAEMLVALAAQIPRSVLFHPAASSAMAAGPLRSRIRRILQLEDDPMLVSGKSIFVMAASFAFAAGLAVIYVPKISQAESSIESIASEFPEVVHFENGAQRFLKGDGITVLEVRGTARTFEPGKKYWIKGKYKLESHDRARLSAFVTATDPNYATMIEDSQTKLVDRGQGEFTLVLSMGATGNPHVSFYPVASGDDFGGIYFGTSSSVLKKWWNEPAEKSTTVAASDSEENIPDIAPVFVVSDINPIQTKSYAISAAHPETLPAVLDGLKKPPYGKYFVFDYKTSKDFKFVDIKAARSAHHMFFTGFISAFNKGLIGPGDSYLPADNQSSASIEPRTASELERDDWQTDPLSITTTKTAHELLSGELRKEGEAEKPEARDAKALQHATQEPVQIPFAFALKRDRYNQVRLYMNNQPVADDVVKNVLSNAAKVSGDLNVSLSAEEGISYAEVKRVRDLLDSIGIKNASLDTVTASDAQAPASFGLVEKAPTPSRDESKSDYSPAALKLLDSFGINPAEPLTSENADNFAELFNPLPSNPTEIGKYELTDQQRAVLEDVFKVFREGPLSKSAPFLWSWNEKGSRIEIHAPKLALSGFFDPIILELQALPASATEPSKSLVAVPNNGGAPGLPPVPPTSDLLAEALSKNNMRALSLAAQNYNAQHKTLPPHAIYSADGKPLLSWRVALLPYLGPEEQELYKQFHLNEPWDSEHNRKLVARIPILYVIPKVGLPDVYAGKTNYLAVVGPECVFDGTATGRDLRHITDGTANTIAFVEANVDQAVEWTKPADWEFDRHVPTRGLGTVWTGHWNGALVDGSQQQFSNNTPADSVGILFTLGGGEVKSLSESANHVANKPAVFLDGVAPTGEPAAVGVAPAAGALQGAPVGAPVAEPVGAPIGFEGGAMPAAAPPGFGYPPGTFLFRLQKDAAGSPVLYLNGEKIGDDQVKGKLPQNQAHLEACTVALSADKGIAYKDVMRVVDLLQSLGVTKMVLDTRAPEGGYATSGSAAPQPGVAPPAGEPASVGVPPTTATPLTHTIQPADQSRYSATGMPGGASMMGMGRGAAGMEMGMTAQAEAATPADDWPKGFAFPSPKEGNIATEAWHRLKIKVLPANKQEQAGKNASGLKVIAGVDPPHGSKNTVFLLAVNDHPARNFDELAGALAAIKNEKLIVAKCVTTADFGPLWINTTLDPSGDPRRTTREESTYPPATTDEPASSGASTTGAANNDPAATGTPAPAQKQVFATISQEALSSNPSALLEAYRKAIKEKVFVDLEVRDGEFALVVTPAPKESDWPGLLGELPRKDRVIGESAWKRLGLKLAPLNQMEQMSGTVGVKILGGNVPKGLPLPTILTKVGGENIENFDALLGWVERNKKDKDSPVRCFATADGKDYMFDASPVEPERLGLVTSNAPAPSSAQQPLGPVTSLAPTHASAEELKVLRERVTIIEEQYLANESLYKKGQKGSSLDRVKCAAYELSLAEGELALAEGRHGDAVEKFKQARTSAEEALTAVQNSYKANRVTHDLLLQAIRNVSDIKLKLIRLQATPATPPESRSAPTYNPPTPSPAQGQQPGVAPLAEEYREPFSEPAPANAPTPARTPFQVLPNSPTLNPVDPNTSSPFNVPALNSPPTSPYGMPPTANDYAPNASFPIPPIAAPTAGMPAPAEQPPLEPSPAEAVLPAVEQRARSLPSGEHVIESFPVGQPEASPVSAGSPQSNLRYDGKTFGQWRNVWQTELSTEKRLEAIKALAAFGRAGYGKEATETILDVASEYDFAILEGEGAPEGALKETVLEALTPQYRPAKLAEFWVPEIAVRSKQDPKKWHWLSVWLFSRLHTDDPKVRAELQSIAGSGPAELRHFALNALVVSDRITKPGASVDKQSRDLIDAALESKDPDTIRSTLPLLLYSANSGGGGQFGGGGGMAATEQTELLSRPALLPLLFNADESIRRQARQVLSKTSEQDSGDAIKYLLGVLNDKSRDRDHLEAVRGLAAVGRGGRLHMEELNAAAELQKICKDPKSDNEMFIAALIGLDEVYGPVLARNTSVAFELARVAKLFAGSSEEELKAIQKRLDEFPKFVPAVEQEAATIFNKADSNRTTSAGGGIF